MDVGALAREVCRRYRGEFPDEEGRYGSAGQAWCEHDNSYLLHWALQDVQGITSLSDQVAWLAGILRARGFPLSRLARDLELCADVVAELAASWTDDVARALRKVAAEVG